MERLKKICQKLLRQRETPSIFGGVLALIQQVSFYITIVNWLMLSQLFYANSTIIRTIFPNYWLFLFLGLGLVVTVGLLFQYKFVLPSQIRFTQYQAYKNPERSPIFKKVLEMSRELSEIRKMLEKEKSGDDG